jgi:polyisoprenoid-binding protein YceI
MTFARSTTPIRRTAIALLGIAAFTTLAAHDAGAQATKSAAKKAQAKRVKAAPVAPIRFTIGASGNEARYRVREQLISLDLPNDAVGVSHDITGSLFVTPNGTVVGDSSRIIVNIANLKSDKSRRDDYIKQHTMDTDKYPTVALAPKSFVGLTAKPGAAPSNFDIQADLTVHGVTRPTTWKVAAHADGSDIVGTATTAFTFKDFELEQPKVPFLLSVEDTIKLEYDFRFTPRSR